MGANECSQGVLLSSLLCQQRNNGPKTHFSRDSVVRRPGLFSLMRSDVAEMQTSITPRKNMKHTRQLSFLARSACLTVFFLSSRVLSGSEERFMDGVGPHHRTRDHAEMMAAEEGGPTTNRPTHTVAASPDRRVIEVATGMHYWDGERWKRSDPSFQVTEDAFIANKLQFKVTLSAQLNGRGAVTIITPDGLTIQSTPVGIGLYDPVSGRSAIIAEVGDCVGTLLARDQVVYQDAFKGISADVVYTITEATFEQDVLIKERVDPSEWGFDPATARIRIFTELYDAPRPERMRRPIRVESDERIRSRMVTPDLVDEVLGFGEFVLSTGRAFRTVEDETVLLVAKETLVAENRVFLVESLEFAPFKEAFELLPARRSASLEKRSTGASVNDDLLATLPPPRPSAPPPAKPRSSEVQLAGAPVKRPPGLVIDYIATIGGTLSGTTVFQAYTTYFVSGPVNCNGATIIESGAVFKFKYAAASPYPSITLNSTLTCKTSPDRPGIFTAVDDDSVGDSLSGYPGSDWTGIINPNYYAKPALKLYFPTTATVSGLQFRYARDALEIAATSSTSVTVAHAQILDCIRGVIITGCGCGSWSGCAATLAVRNSLLARVNQPFVASVPTSGSLSNCTVECSTTLTDARVLTAGSYSASLLCRNSIFANVDLPPSSGSSWSGSYNGFHLCGTGVPFGTSQRVAPASPSPFQSGPGGDYYLNPAQGTYPGNPTSFIDSGSTTANLVGLYHYTTGSALGSKELNGTVDLGFHYPSFNASGQPFDYDGDGIPDIEEDVDGDSIHDSGETNWQVSDSGLSPTVLLDVFTPLR